MTGWFRKNITDLLPPIYTHEDESGDLEVLLSLISDSLDEIKEASDKFPEIFDVDKCDERFLPLLSYVAGHSYDGTDLPENQRRKIREAVEIYRRKGTLPAIIRSLSSIGWNGYIEETFRTALRLNSRSELNYAKLPGNIFSLGVYRIHSIGHAEGVREILSFHHPAGTRAFFLQLLAAFTEISNDLYFYNKTCIRSVIPSFQNETFALGRSKLASCYHLTEKRKIFNLFLITNTVNLISEIESAAIKISRFHGRQDRFRLNGKTLNLVRIPNVSVHEDRVSFCSPVYTGRNQPENIAGFDLCMNKLNAGKLSYADSLGKYCFRQKDFFFDINPQNSEVLWNSQNFGFNTGAVSRKSFQINRSTLNSDDTVNVTQYTDSSILSVSVAGCDAVVTEASDIINRWCGKGPVFKLNTDPLNNRCLTDANVTEERASLEVYTDTSSLQRTRIVPLNLNNHTLNTTSLRLSTDRTAPLRIGSMKLNCAGFRLAGMPYRRII